MVSISKCPKSGRECLRPRRKVDWWRDEERHRIGGGIIQTPEKSGFPSGVLGAGPSGGGGLFAAI